MSITRSRPKTPVKTRSHLSLWVNFKKVQDKIKVITFRFQFLPKPQEPNSARFSGSPTSSDKYRNTGYQFCLFPQIQSLISLESEKKFDSKLEISPGFFPEIPSVLMEFSCSKSFALLLILWLKADNWLSKKSGLVQYLSQFTKVRLL